MPISNKNNANNLSGSKLKINSGTIIKPTITYNTGLGTITISEGIFRLYNTTNYTGLITEHIIPETTLATTDMVTNYLIAQYNDGNPQYAITLDLLDINWSNNTPVYTVARIGDGISVIDWDEPGLGLSNKIHRRLIETRRFERASGLTIGISETRNIIINTGKAWEGSYSSSFPTVDSSIDTMLLWVNNGDGTFSNSIVTQFPNTQYDPKTGTLSTLTDGKYAVIWVYRCMCRPDIDSARIHIFLCDIDASLDQAKACQPPEIPQVVATNAMLVGKIIVQKGSDIPIQIDSAFQTLFAPASASNGVVIGSVQMFAGSIAPSGYHLCLTGDTEVLLADGRKERIDTIVNNKINTDVIAYDEVTGKMSVGKIVDWMKNPAKKDDWMRIHISKGKGFGKRTLTLTKNHPVLTKRGWIEAQHLNRYDIIYRYEDTLTEEGKQALLGIYLGDGTFNKKNSLFSTTHGMNQEEYALYINDIFKTTKYYGVQKSGYGKGKEYIRLGLGLKTFCPDICELMCKNNNIKVSEELLDMIGDVGLAFWYMDDGSLSKDNRYPEYYRANIHTEGFDDNSLEIIQKYFKKNGINTTLYKRNNTKGKMISINRDSSNIFFNKISSYIHPTMLYKIPEKYHTEVKYITAIHKEKVPFVFNIRELNTYHRSKKELDIFKYKYDIKVENCHSFVANGFIVHNCDGSAISRITYSALFNVIGVTYGVGNGSTTFNLPDLKGKISVGLDSSQTEFDTLGEIGGAKTHTLTESEMPSHRHSITGYVRTTYDENDIFSNYSGLDTGNNTYWSSYTGGNQAHNNLQPYLVMNYIIKY